MARRHFTGWFGCLKSELKGISFRKIIKLARIFLIATNMSERWKLCRNGALSMVFPPQAETLRSALIFFLLMAY